jgi:V-type H+-transporting ATPase subunit d
MIMTRVLNRCLFIFSGPYFKNCLSSHDLDELNIEIIRNTLYKAYLEDFYSFCVNELDSESARVMGEILRVCLLTFR